MYFPYLRGRQFELIALRELLENNRMSERLGMKLQNQCGDLIRHLIMFQHSIFVIM